MQLTFYQFLGCSQKFKVEESTGFLVWPIYGFFYWGGHFLVKQNRTKCSQLYDWIQFIQVLAGFLGFLWYNISEIKPIMVDAGSNHSVNSMNKNFCSWKFHEQLWFKVCQNQGWQISLFQGFWLVTQY